MNVNRATPRQSNRLKKIYTSNYYKNIRNKQVFNTNVFKNSSLLNQYNRGARIYYWRVNTMVNNMSHVNLGVPERGFPNGRQQQLPYAQQPSAPCLVGAQKFLGQEQCAPKQRYRETRGTINEENGNFYSPNKRFTYKSENLFLGSPEFQQIIEKMPVGYGIRVATVRNTSRNYIPEQHAFVIYKSNPNILKVMLHLSNKSLWMGRRNRSFSYPYANFSNYLINAKMINPYQHQIRLIYLEKK